MHFSPLLDIFCEYSLVEMALGEIRTNNRNSCKCKYDKIGLIIMPSINLNETFAVRMVGWKCTAFK